MGVRLGLTVAAAALALAGSQLKTVSFPASVVCVGGGSDHSGGAVAAYIAAERYEFLWIEYSRTASELRRLIERRTAADGSPLSGSELVSECEQVISVQNQAWMAKWGEESAATAN